MIEIVDPRGPRESRASALAPRRAAGELRRIGLLCNEASVAHGTMHFSRYLRILQRVLPARLGAVEFITETKPILTRPADVAQLERFRGWHAVINGLGK
jgi:hypothetical protein